MEEQFKEIEVLIDVAVLGKQVDEFFKSDVGDYLIKNIDSEILSGYNDLKSVSFSNTDAVRIAQNKVWRAEALKEWLTQAVTAGVRAMQVLESREDD